MISIAHGAEGLSWFLYQSYKIDLTDYAGPWLFGNLSQNAPHDSLHILSLLDPYPNTILRKKNVYGQNKSGYVSQMNQKILHWKSTLDKIKWDVGYSVHSEGAAHNFISDIKSIYYDVVPPYTFSSGNNDPVKYWEMGFFEPDFENPDVSANDKSKYFMMVNRRCVPNVSNDGDLRQLKIQFDSSQLSGFNNWKIIDLDSDKMQEFLYYKVVL